MAAQNNMSRSEASKINPFIGELFSADTLHNVNYVLSWLGTVSANYSPDDSETPFRGFFYISRVIEAALAYEAAQKGGDHVER